MDILNFRNQKFPFNYDGFKIIKCNDMFSFYKMLLNNEISIVLNGIKIELNKTLLINPISKVSNYLSFNSSNILSRWTNKLIDENQDIIDTEKITNFLSKNFESILSAKLVDLEFLINKIIFSSISINKEKFMTNKDFNFILDETLKQNKDLVLIIFDDDWLDFSIVKKLINKVKTFLIISDISKWSEMFSKKYNEVWLIQKENAFHEVVQNEDYFVKRDETDPLEKIVQKF
ncbi:MAG: hypothetical protein LBP70_03295 [Mycoplasmataceae bacterium]|nr:hypothetical protein [Mycoplasmataceae bacterium]